MKATAKDLRFHSKEILDSVSRGEEVVITYRGKPHAKIVPINPEPHTIQEEHLLFGIWQNNDSFEDVEQYIREKRKGRMNAH